MWSDSPATDIAFEPIPVSRGALDGRKLRAAQRRCHPVHIMKRAITPAFPNRVCEVLHGQLDPTETTARQLRPALDGDTWNAFRPLRRVREESQRADLQNISAQTTLA